MGLGYTGGVHHRDGIGSKFLDRVRRTDRAGLTVSAQIHPQQRKFAGQVLADDIPASEIGADAVDKQDGLAAALERVT